MSASDSFRKSRKTPSHHEMKKIQQEMQIARCMKGMFKRTSDFPWLDADSQRFKVSPRSALAIDKINNNCTSFSEDCSFYSCFCKHVYIYISTGGEGIDNLRSFPTECYKHDHRAMVTGSILPTSCERVHVDNPSMWPEDVTVKCWKVTISSTKRLLCLLRLLMYIVFWFSWLSILASLGSDVGFVKMLIQHDTLNFCHNAFKNPVLWACVFLRAFLMSCQKKLPHTLLLFGKQTSILCSKSSFRFWSILMLHLFELDFAMSITRQQSSVLLHCQTEHLSDDLNFSLDWLLQSLPFYFFEGQAAMSARSWIPDLLLCGEGETCSCIRMSPLMFTTWRPIFCYCNRGFGS